MSFESNLCSDGRLQDLAMYTFNASCLNYRRSKHPKLSNYVYARGLVYGNWKIKTLNRGHGAPSRNLQTSANWKIATPSSAKLLHPSYNVRYIDILQSGLARKASPRPPTQCWNGRFLQCQGNAFAAVPPRCIIEWGGGGARRKSNFVDMLHF